MNRGFSNLEPSAILDAAEDFCGIRFFSQIISCNSYVNRVFKLTDTKENHYIIKFYRSGRWSEAAISDKHDFLYNCKQNGLNVIPPVLNKEKSSIGKVGDIMFAIFPFQKGPNFDIFSTEDYYKFGKEIGKLHQVGRKTAYRNRLKCIPSETTEQYIRFLLGLDTKKCFIPENLKYDFIRTCDCALDYIEDLFSRFIKDDDFISIHGDCHLGNILQNNGNLILLDFDDMMTGPAIQDLWLVLPSYRKESSKELSYILEGYEEYSPFDINQLNLIEALRFMRHIYFLAWQAIQSDDNNFLSLNPQWKSKSFWEEELFDLKKQLDIIKEDYSFIKDI